MLTRKNGARVVRMMTIEEGAALQTFPAEFVLHGAVRDRWRMIGNAVPPRMAEDCASALMRGLQLLW